MAEQERDEASEALLDEAEACLDRGDPETALQLCGQALALIPTHPGALFVRGDALRGLGRLHEAVEAYRGAALARPEHASSWASLGLTLFELLEVPEARRCASRAIREDPRHPEGWWLRSLMLEWEGDLAGAERALLHARWLDPDGYPLPPRLNDDEMEALVEEVLLYLHPTIRDYLTNVPIMVDELPGEEILREYDPPASPLSILGYFNGHSLMERSSNDPWTTLPPSIVLFRRNIERQATDRDHLVEQLRVTLFHEIGHFLGLDEEDLEDRGLE